MPQEWGFREEQGLTILQGHGGGRVGGVAEDRGLGKGLSGPTSLMIYSLPSGELFTSLI